MINLKKLNLIKSLINIPRHDYLSLLKLYAKYCLEIQVVELSKQSQPLSTPVVNIGKRQNLREKNANVIDSGFNENQLTEEVHQKSKEIDQ